MSAARLLTLSSHRSTEGCLVGWEAFIVWCHFCSLHALFCVSLSLCAVAYLVPGVLSR